MPKIPRYLITTADERTWKFDCPVIFLGEWCCLYDRKHVWQKMDAITARPFGLDHGQKDNSIIYVQLLAKTLLSELTSVLNKFQGTQYSERYWEILLGHWLQRYVAITFNRYFAIEQVLREYDVIGTTIIDSSADILAKKTSLEFWQSCMKDSWNLSLYSKVLAFIGTDKLNISLSNIGENDNSESRSDINSKERAIKKIIAASKKQLYRLSKNNDAFIVNTYLPLKEEIKLQVSLWQFPQLWESPEITGVNPDKKTRDTFHINSEHHKGYEKFVRLSLKDIIPVCFLEGYSALRRQTELLVWPAKPKYIFTSNSFDTDEVFKAWTGSKVEKGIKYFVGQHGNNYGTHKYSGNRYWPDQTASDKFITWGWTNGNKHNIPAFIFKMAGQKENNRNNNGGLLLIEVHIPMRDQPFDSDYEHKLYQDEQYRFVQSLPERIQNHLSIRLHYASKSLYWSESKRWHDFNAQLSVDEGGTPISKIIADSRLVVHSYDSTGILENLSMNIPTICFWYNGLNHLIPKAKPYYEQLHNAGILAYTAEEAAKMVTVRWDNVDAWWKSDDVQQARKLFCDQYARIEKKPVQVLKKILEKYL